MKISICIATHDKPRYLLEVLGSIYRQPLANDPETEVIVVDDRSVDENNRNACNCYPVKYIRIDGNPGYKNPSRARNVAYRHATGEVIIAQSDDTKHISENCIEM